MSFWKTMPVVVQNTTDKDSFKELVPKEYFMSKLTKELQNTHIPFEYKVYDNTNIDDNFYNDMKAFFDKEYGIEINNCLKYGIDLYKYFIPNALVCVIYTPNYENTVGYMVGKNTTLNINKKNVGILEVSFFCIAEKYRKQHYTPYFINILLKEFIIRYNIYIGTYAISDMIKAPHYASKDILHKPLNIDKLIKCNFLPPSTKYYTNFEIDTNVDCVYINNQTLPDNLIQVLTDKLNKYQRKQYTVYKVFSYQDVKRMFENKDFHNFIIFNKDQTIRDFLSLYKVDILVQDIQLSYRASSIYCFFLNNYNTEYIRSVLDTIAYYCKKYDLIDVISFFDIFNVKDYRELNCLYGDGNIKYYIVNYTMPGDIPNYKNGYVTI